MPFNQQQQNIPPQVMQWLAQNPQAVQQYLAQAYNSMNPAGTMNWNRPVSLSSQPSNMNLGMAAPANNQAPSYIYGKMITNLQDVRLTDVPMDGSASIFPMNDFSCIYAKAWGSDGTIQTLKFVPEKPPENMSENSVPSELAQVMARLDDIQNLLMQPVAAKKPSSTQKKEVMSNE